MKKFLTRIICLLLILATLLPMIVACKDDDVPPDPDVDDPTVTTDTPVVTASVSSYNYMPILNLSDFDALKAIPTNRDLTNLDTTKSKPTIKWQVSYSNTLLISLPEPVYINDYYYIEFSVFADAPSKKTWKLEFLIDSATAVGSTDIVMDFSGEQKFLLKQDAISVKNPVPAINMIRFSCSDTSTLTEQPSYAYITSINAAHPVFAYNVPESIDLNDSSIYDSLLNNWVNYNTANNSDIFSSEKYKKLIRDVDKDGNLIGIEGLAERYWNEFKATYQEGVNGSLYGAHMYDSKQDYTGDLKYLNDYNEYAEGILAVCKNLEKMALAYACKHTKYYQNKDMLADILKGLEYQYEYGYGKLVLENGTYGDWYPWDASIPTALINILIYIRNDIDQALIAKYLEPFNKILPLPFGTAANLIFMSKNVLLASALTKDGQRIARTNYLMQEVFRYIDEIPKDEPRTGTKDGFYTDGSFIQHGGIPYQGSYGIGLIQNLVPLMYIGSGTAFEVKGDDVHHQYEWIFNSYVPIISGDRQFVSHDGRSNTTTGMERANTHRMLGCALVMSAYAPEPYASQLKSMIKYFTVTVGTTPTSYVPISFLEHLEKINIDTAVTPAEQYVGGKVFGNADTVVQHTPSYSVCVAMSSNRIAKYESINGANETGWYHRDGMIYVYTEGYDFSKTWMFIADPYLMPGTTVNLETRNEVNTPLIYGTNTYAGGVEQGKYSIAGMILDYGDEAYTNYWGTHSSYSTLAATRIYAKKSYFMFDDEIVCIGTDIRDESGKDVVTVVENRLWGMRIANNFEKKEDYFYLNGKLVNFYKPDETTGTPESVETTGSPESDKTISTPESVETTVEARTMHFSNMGGYIFMDHVEGSTKDSSGNTVTYKKATHSPRASTGLKSEAKTFLEIKINHGVNAANGKQYAYMYLPEATVEETEAYSKTPDVVMLKRNADCHAVLETTLGIVAANIFNTDGASFNVNNSTTAVKKVAAQDCPASVIISKGENGEYHISASDPTHTFRNVTLEIKIEGVTSVVSQDAAVRSATVNGGVVTVTFDTTDARGASFSLTVK